jgi:hypothetical protein
MASGLWERLRKGRRDNSDESAPRSWQPSNPGQGAPEDAAGSEVASPEQATKSNAVVLGLLAIAALDELFEREGRSQEDGRRVPGL